MPFKVAILSTFLLVTTFVLFHVKFLIPRVSSLTWYPDHNKTRRAISNFALARHMFVVCPHTDSIVQNSIVSIVLFHEYKMPKRRRYAMPLRTTSSSIGNLAYGSCLLRRSTNVARQEIATNGEHLTSRTCNKAINLSSVLFGLSAVEHILQSTWLGW